MSVLILSYDSEKHFCLKTFFLVKWFRPYFYIITATPISPKNPPLPWKKSPPSKNWDPFKPPYLKIWLEAQPSPLPQQTSRNGGGAHYDLIEYYFFSKMKFRSNWQIYSVSTLWLVFFLLYSKLQKSFLFLRKIWN